MLTTRRALVLGAAFAASPFAQAQSADPRKHIGFNAWSDPGVKIKAPLDKTVDTGTKVITIREWMQGAPAVLSLWATWCGPCLAEKQNQAAMSARLVKAGARLRFLAIQAFDDVSLEEGRAVLKRLHADTITNARASPGAEKAFIGLFGKSPVDSSRTSMPALMLVAADGTILGGAIGMMPNPSQTGSYWADDTTFDFLSKL